MTTDPWIPVTLAVAGVHVVLTRIDNRRRRIDERAAADRERHYRAAIRMLRGSPARADTHAIR